MEFYCTTILLLCVSAALAIICAIVSGILKLTGRPFLKNFKRGLWSLLIFPVLILYGTLIERNLTNIEEVEITSEKLPEPFDGYRIVQISDVHLRSFEGRSRTLNKIVEEINSLDADAILIAGGKSQGIKEGMTFSIMSKGKKVKNPQTGMNEELPGTKVGVITITSSFGDTPETELSFCSYEGDAIDVENLVNYYIMDK